MRTNWTKEEIALCHQLAAKNLGPAEIAEKIGKSRSAVSARISRDKKRNKITKTDPDNMEPELAVVSNENTKETGKSKKAKTSKKFKPPRLLTNFREWPIDKIGHNGCRWPMGDVHPSHPDFCFCGERTNTGPYCQEHAQRAFNQTHKG